VQRPSSEEDFGSHFGPIVAMSARSGTKLDGAAYMTLEGCESCWSLHGYCWGGDVMALQSIFFFPFFGFGFVLYFLPWIIALVRGKRDTLGIFLLNFFLGWTFIGWIVALVWAVKADPPAIVHYVQR